MSNEFEDAIAKYRAELRAGAELADGDLDEIEDHLRSLTDELRARGMPAAEAVTEAARRLGEPRAIAREHSRVRSAFGARLSTARTWSVVALLVPMALYSIAVRYPFLGLWNRYNLEVAVELFLVAALVLRMGWARPVLLGAAASSLVLTLGLQTFVVDGEPLWIVWNVGLFAFLVPWRRGEITASGFALIGFVWAYTAASFALSFQVTTPDGIHGMFVSTAAIACIACAVASIGAILRARWSSVAGVIAAGALAVTTYQLIGLSVKLTGASAFEVMIVSLLGSGTAAAAIGGILGWRTARSTLGSLHAIRS